MKCECCRREVVADDLYTLQIEAAERPTFELTVCRACLPNVGQLYTNFCATLAQQERDKGGKVNLIDWNIDREREQCTPPPSDTSDTSDKSAKEDH